MLRAGPGPPPVPRLERDWLLIADRGFYNWADWQAAAATGAALLWRVKADLRLPVLELLPDGSCLSIVVRPAIHDKARNKLIAAARDGEHLDPGQAVRVRVVEYEVPDRDGDGSGELIALITTITDPRTPPPASWPGLTASGGKRKPAMTSSRPACADRGRSCGQRARTWSARRSTATCSPTTPSRP